MPNSIYSMPENLNPAIHERAAKRDARLARLSPYERLVYLRAAGLPLILRTHPKSLIMQLRLVRFS